MKQTTFLFTAVVFASIFASASSDLEILKTSIQDKINNKTGIIGLTVAAAVAEKSIKCLNLDNSDVYIHAKNEFGIRKFRAVIQCSSSNMITIDGDIAAQASDLDVTSISFGVAD